MKYYISEYIKVLENKLQWGDSQKWREGQFSQLSKLIQEKTDILISNHTLKRFLGRLKTNEDYLPQGTTLDALAKFIGYETWIKYEECFNQVLKSQDKLNDTNLNKNKTKIRIKREYIFLFLLLIGFIFIITFFLLNQPNSDYSFKANPISGNAPLSVIFKYNISKLHGTIYVNFNDSKYSKSKDNILLDKNKNTLTNYYPISGFYKAQLIQNNKIIDSLAILVKSNGWEKLIALNNKEKKTSSFHTFNTKINNGTLHFTKEELNARNLDSTNFNLSEFKLVNDFNINGDNFLLETRIKDNFFTDNRYCNFFRLIINCEHKLMDINFTDSTCFPNSFIKISEIYISGKNNDLSNLGINFIKWKDLVLIVKDKKAILKIDNKKVAEIKYNQAFGNIRVFLFQFTNIGEIDYFRLYNDKRLLVYSEDFN